MEKGLDHEMLGSFYSVFTIFILFFHVVYNLILAKYFFLWLVLVSFIFSRIKLLLSKLVSLLKDIKKKKKTTKNKQTNKQAQGSVSQFTLTVAQNYFKECFLNYNEKQFCPL